MFDFHAAREARGDGARFRLQGIFSPRAAAQLLAELGQESGPVEVDFSALRQCLDVGLVALAAGLRSLKRAGAPVALFGLGLHHRRLLLYFGLDLGTSVQLGDDLQPDAQPPRPKLAHA